MEILEKLADGKLYVENVRAFLNIPRENALFLCEQGVREHLFERKTGLLCANCKRTIFEAVDLKGIPERVVCTNCEDLEEEEFEFSSNLLDTLPFYTLVQHDS